MSYDLMVLDKRKRFKDAQDFFEWYDKVTEWAEDVDYNDYRHTTPHLQNWFLEMKDIVPPMNGEFAPSMEDIGKSELGEADYSIGKDAIYVAFGWSNAEQISHLVQEKAKKHDVAFYDVSGFGDVVYPDGEILRTTVQSVQEQKIIKMYEEACKKESKRRNIIQLIFFGLFVVVFVMDFFVKLYFYIAFSVTCLMAVLFLLLNKWANKSDDDVLKKFQQKWQQQQPVNG